MGLYCFTQDPRGGWRVLQPLASSPSSPTFSVGHLAQRILQGLQVALRVCPHPLRPQGTSGEIQAEPPEVSLEDSKFII